MRSIMVLLLGLLGGLFMMWAFRQGMRPTALLRLPRAFTDIIRSKPAAAGPAAAAAPRAAAAGAAPAAKGGASAAAGKRKAAAAAAAALEEEEEAEAAAEAKAKAKPARRGGASSRKATKAVEEEEEEEEEAEEEAAAAEAEEEVEEAKPVKQTAAQKRAAAAKKGGAKAPAAAAAPAAAEDAKPKKITRRNLGKEKGKEPNPAGFVDPKTGKLPAAGAAGVAIPPAPVSEPDGPSSLPRKTIVPAKARPALPKVFKSEGDIPEFCEGPERFPEEPVEWHIVEEEEIDREAYPCHLANVTHWALKYWYKLGSVKICTHDPLVDEVSGAAGRRRGAAPRLRDQSVAGSHQPLPPPSPNPPPPVLPTRSSLTTCTAGPSGARPTSGWCCWPLGPAPPSAPTCWTLAPTWASSP